MYIFLFILQDDIEKLSDIKLLISQLYESFNVKEYHAHKEHELLTKIEKIQCSLKPLEDVSTIKFKLIFKFQYDYGCL